jgi:hypothetical protein
MTKEFCSISGEFNCLSQNGVKRGDVYCPISRMFQSVGCEIVLALCLTVLEDVSGKDLCSHNRT